MSRPVRKLLPTLGATASLVFAGLGVSAMAAPGAVADAPDAVTCSTGIVEVHDASSGDVVSYLRSAGAGYIGLTPDKPDATSVSIQSGTAQNLLDATAASTGAKYVGMLVGARGDTMGPGSAAYTLSTNTSSSPAGSGPTDGGSFSSYESAVWSLDGASGALTAEWVNPGDAPSAPVPLILNIIDNAYTGGTGDLGSLRDSFPFDTFTEATFKLADVTTVAGPCEGTAQTQTQTIAFTAPTPSQGYVDDDVTVAATGGGSGNDVTFSSTTPDVCTVDGTTVHLAATGTCTVAADQLGNDDYDAAATVTQDIAVQQVASQIALTTPAGAVAGQSVHATATITTDAGEPDGDVQFSLDGKDLGDPVALDGDGEATSPTFTHGAGDAGAAATFVPNDPDRYLGSSIYSGFTVAQALSNTTVSTTGSTIVARVGAQAPSGSVPTGEVTFAVDGTSVGTASLVDGVATLDYAVPTDNTHGVSATYAGDDDVAGSVDSTTRDNPSITSQINAIANAYGWFHKPVTLTWTCTPGGAELTKACPRPSTLSADGRRVIVRTTSAVDGGVASVATKVNIDRTAPTVKVTGPRNGARYTGSAPVVGCSANDSLSGVLSCTTATVKGKGGTRTTVATARDRAGNVSSARATYTVR